MMTNNWDEAALERVADVSDTETENETVTVALRESGEHLGRARALAELGFRGEAGDFDALLDKRAYRKRSRRLPGGQRRRSR